MTGRRLLGLAIVLGAIAIPAVLLQVACVGRSCDARTEPAGRVPFCPLPERLRTLLSNGYREGRSPDVLGVAAEPGVFTDDAGLLSPWPAVGADDRVPIVFAGAGIVEDAPVPDGTTLDRVAPTVAEALRFDRSFPDVRSGTPIAGIVGGDTPTIVLFVVWKGVGSRDLEAWPVAWPSLERLARDGAATIRGATGSLPLDPAATIATIGTGGLPSQHGITGSIVRGDDGRVVDAFADGAPVPVIATLADDLDAPDSPTGPSPFEQRPVVALVATDPADRGLIGGDWYEGHDRDEVAIADGDGAVGAARELLASMGDDDAPDVLGVVMDGSIRSLDRRTAEIVAAADRASGGSTLVVVAGSGTTELRRLAASDDAIVAAAEDAVPGETPAVTASVPGGVFLDQVAMRQARVTGQVVVGSMLAVSGPGGGRMMADAFQGFAVSFARYC